MVHTIVVLHVNIIDHNTKEILEKLDLKQALEDYDFDEYLNSNSVTWQDDLTIEEMMILEVQENHYIFINIEHDLSLDVLDIILQEWVVQSSYSPFLYDFMADKSCYLDIVDAVIVDTCTVPDAFTHRLKVSVLDEQNRTFLTNDQTVIKLTPPTITVLGIKDGNTIRPSP